ncbi:hypothetical protein L228DRAFT_145379 [Xylona heveae TC161]|uniref:Uncharacterized protein n=1 Tax=Xylona heveae (strain CBS 132557 / TC161) TaxID=1328760 RepID=A0A165GCW8_XYLHT|nr:hypothetical protein L228DRAFT_145379 [Xylona heveae TC161]KZF22040.1 hypothetical protein L228DRAFT_145379 [Xylona heveae TC161]
MIPHNIREMRPCECQWSVALWAARCFAAPLESCLGPCRSPYPPPAQLYAYGTINLVKESARRLLDRSITVSSIDQ